MTRDLFLEILENNPKLNEYDLQQMVAVIEDAVDENIVDEYYLNDMEFFQSLIEFMEEYRYEILNIKRLKEFLQKNN